MVYFGDRYAKYRDIGSNRPLCYCFNLKAGKNLLSKEEQKEREEKMQQLAIEFAKENAVKDQASIQRKKRNIRR